MSRRIIEGSIALGGFKSIKKPLKYRLSPVHNQDLSGAVGISLSMDRYQMGAIATQAELKQLISDLQQFVVEDDEGNK